MSSSGSLAGIVTNNDETGLEYVVQCVKALLSNFSKFSDMHIMYTYTCNSIKLMLHLHLHVVSVEPELM